MQATLFKTPPSPNQALHEAMLSHKAHGRSTNHTWKDSTEQIPVYENEFWTAKQRDAHSLHEISYRACFKPQLPRFFIERFTQPGDVVFDPFMGRGTTALEAALLDRRAVGCDVNPLCRVLASPRLTPPALDKIEQRLHGVDLKALQNRTNLNNDLLTFFHPQTLREIEAWRIYFKGREADGTFDNVDAWLQMTACNRLTGHSPGFFSVYTMPPNQAVSLEAQRKINARLNQKPEYRDTKVLIWRKSRALLRDGAPPLGEHQIFTSSADSLAALPDESVALLVTSPPFLDVVNYKSDNWLRAWFCSVDLQAADVWQMKHLAEWREKMQTAFAEWRRVLRPGGMIAFETGEIRKGKLLLENTVLEIAEGFTPLGILVNAQRFTKTANCWGVENMQKGTNSNRVLILSKQ